MRAGPPWLPKMLLLSSSVRRRASSTIIRHHPPHRPRGRLSPFSSSAPARDDDDAVFLRAHAPRAIDVHTHMYPPASYMKLLRSRTEVPRVVSLAGEERLIILPGEDEETTTAAGVRGWIVVIGQ